MTTKYTKNFGLALPDFRQGPWHDLINNDLVNLDSLIFGAMSQANVVPWENSKSFIVGETVLDASDATVWMSTLIHTSPATGTFEAYRIANPTHWVRLLTGFAPRGEWMQSTQYFPYDLAYDSAHAIMALCEVKHISTATGSIRDDEANWAFLLDLSMAELATAATVTYTNATSPTIPADNVQDAIDYIESQLVELDNINIMQGENIDALEDNVANAVLHLAGNQTVTGGFRFVPFNAGTPSGTFIPDAMKGNYQYLTNGNAFTFTTPTSDCAIDILIVNSATAGVVTFTGYTVGLNVGEPLTTTNGSKFVVSIRRIINVSTYSVRALQ